MSRYATSAYWIGPLRGPGPQSSGKNAYNGIHQKAAALLQSVVSNNALIDGNKRLGLVAVIVFYGVNGYRLTMDNDEAYDLIIAVASGELRDVQQLADRLAAGTTEYR